MCAQIKLYKEDNTYFDKDSLQDRDIIGEKMAAMDIFLIVVIYGFHCVNAAYWIVTIYVGDIYLGNSLNTFYLDINGTRNDMTGFNLGAGYHIAERRQFDIFSDFGEIISIRIFQHNNDGLFLDKVVMSDGKRQYSFACGCWIQNDFLSASSQPSWTLTTTDCQWNDTSVNCSDVRGRYCKKECDRCDRHLRLDGTSCFTGKII